MREVSLYLHIPFCVAKCAYCDFASWPNRLRDADAYVSALLDEMRSHAEAMRDARIPTVFFGGGTPSLLTQAQFARLFGGIRECFALSPDAEITCEANPGTLTPEKLCALRKLGVNRLSLGVQSFCDARLKRIGRIHTAAEAAQAVAMARDAGFDNLSLDLIYALPGQTLGEWRETLEAAVALCPEHISAYNLILEEGTPLYADVRAGSCTPCDEDAEIAMQRLATSLLAQAGYARYEISNYAKPGRECRHNIVYWQRGEYLGLGCAAHSFVGGARFANPRLLDAYLRGERRESFETVSRESAMQETLMLATRMTRGMDLARYREEFGEDFAQTHQSTLEMLARHGLAQVRDGCFRLTETGLEVQNAVVAAFL